MKQNNKKVKLNDKVDKKKRMKPVRYVSEETRELRKFIIILLSIIAIVIVVYGISKVLIKDKDETTGNDVTAGVVDYDIVSIGTMLNRNIDEYYVMIYDANDSNAVLYSSMINKYISKEKAKKIFFCDLGNKLNSEYYAKDKDSNPKAKSINELALKELTLIKVKNGKIVKYIEDVDTMKKELDI